MHNLRSAAFVALLSFASANAAPPDPVESEYLRSAYGGFIMVKGSPVYALTLEIVKTLPAGASLRFLFENPRKGESPITSTGLLEIDEEKILVQSTPLECIRNKRKYDVVIEIYSDDSFDNLLGTHVQKLEFRLPKKLFKSVGLKAC